MVPHFITAAKGPILELEKRLLDATPTIERWLRMEWQEHSPPFYASVDLRNAGFKLAPVDTNFYPAGFNHLSDDMLPLAVQASMAAVDKVCANARQLLLLLDENALAGAATQAPDYFANLHRLASILRQSGLEVRFGSHDPRLQAMQTMLLPDGQTMQIEPVVMHGKRIGLKDFDPCVLLSNSASGHPTLTALRGGTDSQIVLPPLHAAWPIRRKSTHFLAYQSVAKRFAKAMGLDPWLITPTTIPFRLQLDSDLSVQHLKNTVDQVLRQTRAKYREYGIQSRPFVILKSDAGCGGKGVVTVRNAKELMQLVGKLHDKCALASKSFPDCASGALDILVQEGVPTEELVEQASAEPVVYLIDRYVVGGFYRLNAQRGPDENLQAAGMQVKPLPFAGNCNTPDCVAQAKTNRFFAYGVVARLALIAASIELERTDPDQALYGN